jgi:hypothetical protein
VTTMQSTSPSGDEVEAARLLLARMGLRPEDPPTGKLCLHQLLTHHRNRVRQLDKPIRGHTGPFPTPPQHSPRQPPCYTGYRQEHGRDVDTCASSRGLAGWIPALYATYRCRNGTVAHRGST